MDFNGGMFWKLLMKLFGGVLGSHEASVHSSRLFSSMGRM